MMRRREVITLLGSAAAWPIAARAQQDPMRRIGVLNDYTEADPVGQAQLAAFRDELGKLGWTDGRNVRIDYRTGAADNDAIRTYAAEIIASRPDVVLAAGATVTAALQRASRSVPIVFVNATDPVGGGLVASLARPGGNTTGFTQFEFGLSAKWLELLKEIAPAITRVAVIRDPTARTGGGQLGAIQAVAPSLGIELTPIDPHEPDEMERALVAFASDRRSGLVVTTSRLARAHRDIIVALAGRHRLPAAIRSASTSPTAASSPTAPIRPTHTGAQPAISIGFSRARSQPTCRCRRRSSTSSLSISRPLKRSASTFPIPFSPVPTR